MEGRDRGSRGQSVVELALLLPFLLLICGGVVDFGRAYHYDIALINAARTGARVAADTRQPDSAVAQAVKADASPISLLDSDISVSPAAPRALGSTVTVRVTYRFTPITPLIGSLFSGGTVTISKSASMVAL